MKIKFIIQVFLFLTFCNLKIFAAEFTKRPIDWELFQAVEYGLDVRPLINKGADVDAKSLTYVSSIFEGDTPWTLALRRSRPEVIAILSEHRNKNLIIPSELQVEIFGAAIFTYQKGNSNYSIDRIKLLIKYGLDINAILLEPTKRKWRTSNDGLSALMIAVRANRIDIAMLLLDFGANINLVNRDGKSALNFSKSSEMTNLLIDKGAKFTDNEKNHSSLLKDAILNGRLDVVITVLNSKILPNKEVLEDALIIASRVKGQTSNIEAHNSSAQIVDALIKHGANPNIIPGPLKARGAPLFEAVYTSNRAVVGTLLSNHADPLNAKNTDGGSLLSMAVQQSDPEIVKMLWPYYQPLDAKLEKELITTAGLYGKFESVQMLSTLGIKWKNYPKDTLMTFSHFIERGDLGLVTLLINQGIDINQKEIGTHSFLVQSIRQGNIEIVKKLIENGALTSTKDELEYNVDSPIRAALHTGNIEVFQLLLKNGAKVKEDKFLIHFLPYNQYIFNQKSRSELLKKILSLLEIILKEGISIDYPDQEGRTLLTKMSSDGNNILLRYAIDSGANINYIPTKCSTMKPTSQKIESIASLGDHGASARNNDNRIAITSDQFYNFFCLAPISIAIQNNNFENAKSLLIGKANINQFSLFNGMSPLMVAAMIGNPEIISWLLDNGANTKLKNNAGQTAFDIAMARENTKAAELIQSFKH